MKKKFLPILILAIVIGVFGAFKPNKGTKVLEEMTETYHQELQDISNAFDEYSAVAADFTNDKASIEALQETHLAARMSFKQVEYLLEYYDPSAVKKFLNGAPLPTVEPSVPEVIQLDPVGLQVLDELVFSDDPFAEKEEIVRLTNKLVKDYQNIQRVQQSIRLQHRHIFEAMREELVRIFTLGMTGFDTPGSGNALEEAKVTLTSIQTAYQKYQDLLAEKDFGVALVLDARLKEAIKFMDNFDDFNTFDRLTYLVNFHNHLYEMLLEAHHALSIETKAEINDRAHAVNYESRQLFSKDFLNVSYFAKRDMEYEKNDERIALGRLLFFDPILSNNNERSCASCHDPVQAFTDGQSKSIAYNGAGTIKRNSPTLLNCVYNERFFYDMRQSNLEKQVKHVIFDSLEFNTTFSEITTKLEQSKEYEELFTEAYGESMRKPLSPGSINDALACYVASLTTFNSPFDKYVRGETALIEESVHRGFILFMGKASCGTCHFAPTFNGTVPPRYMETETEILGTPATAENKELDTDLGRFASKFPRDKAPFYKHSFRTPTVRNVGLTAPYMHNGVYETLEEVIDFYNKGGGAGMGIDVPYQTLPDAPLNLTEQDKKDLIAFMNALTDENYDQEIPTKLPTFEKQPEWNKRVIGGTY